MGRAGVGDSSFQAKWRKTFKQRKAHSGLIMVSHNPGTIKKHCDMAAVLYKEKLHFYDNVSRAIKFYEKYC